MKIGCSSDSANLGSQTRSPSDLFLRHGTDSNQNLIQNIIFQSFFWYFQLKFDNHVILQWWRKVLLLLKNRPLFTISINYSLMSLFPSNWVFSMLCGLPINLSLRTPQSSFLSQYKSFSQLPTTSKLILKIQSTNFGLALKFDFNAVWIVNQIKNTILKLDRQSQSNTTKWIEVQIDRSIITLPIFLFIQ